MGRGGLAVSVVSFLKKIKKICSKYCSYVGSGDLLYYFLILLVKWHNLREKNKLQEK